MNIHFKLNEKFIVQFYWLPNWLEILPDEMDTDDDAVTVLFPSNVPKRMAKKNSATIMLKAQLDLRFLIFSSNPTILMDSYS